MVQFNRDGFIVDSYNELYSGSETPPFHNNPPSIVESSNWYNYLYSIRTCKFNNSFSFGYGLKDGNYIYGNTDTTGTLRNPSVLAVVPVETVASAPTFGTDTYSFKRGSGGYVITFNARVIDVNIKHIFPQTDIDLTQKFYDFCGLNVPESTAILQGGFLPMWGNCFVRRLTASDYTYDEDSGLWGTENNYVDRTYEANGFVMSIGEGSLVYFQDGGNLVNKTVNDSGDNSAIVSGRYTDYQAESVPTFSRENERLILRCPETEITTNYRFQYSDGKIDITWGNITTPFENFMEDTTAAIEDCLMRYVQSSLSSIYLGEYIEPCYQEPAKNGYGLFGWRGNGTIR